MYSFWCHSECRGVGFCIGTDMEKWSSAPMDPLQWMGAIRMRVQKASQSFNYHNSSSSLCEAKSYTFVIKS